MACAVLYCALSTSRLSVVPLHCTYGLDAGNQNHKWCVSVSLGGQRNEKLTKGGGV